MRLSKINKSFVLFIVLWIIPVILFSPIGVKAKGSESDNANAGSIVKGNIVNIVYSNKAWENNSIDVFVYWVLDKK